MKPKRIFLRLSDFGTKHKDSWLIKIAINSLIEQMLVGFLEVVGHDMVTLAREPGWSFKGKFRLSKSIFKIQSRVLGAALAVISLNWRAGSGQQVAVSR